MSHLHIIRDRIAAVKAFDTDMRRAMTQQAQLPRHKAVLPARLAQHAAAIDLMMEAAQRGEVLHYSTAERMRDAALADLLPRQDSVCHFQPQQVAA